MSNDISKLPKWAQDYIRDIERQRDVSVRALNQYLDNQTESEFYFDDYIGTGESNGRGPTLKRNYIQAPDRLAISYADVLLEVVIRDGEVHISWGGDVNRDHDVAFIPMSYQHAKIIAKNNMR